MADARAEQGDQADAVEAMLRGARLLPEHAERWSSDMEIGGHLQNAWNKLAAERAK